MRYLTKRITAGAPPAQPCAAHPAPRRFGKGHPILAYGAEDIVREWHTRNKDKEDPLKLAYMVRQLWGVLSRNAVA